MTESSCLTETHLQILKPQKNNNKKTKRRDTLAAAPASSLSPKTTPTPTRNAEQLADQLDDLNVPASVKRQCTHGPCSFYGCCNFAGGLVPKRAGGERPKGGLDQILHGTSQDSCIHTSQWHDLEDVGAAQTVPKERSAEGTRLSVAFCRGRCGQKHSLCYPACAGSRQRCWRNMWLLYLHHYQTQIKSKWLKTIWCIMCNTFQQLSSVSHVEISTSWNQMSSSDLITTKQLKKLQLNSQQSWNSPWTQGRQRALEESQCFQKRSCRQLRLPLPYAAAFTYESWMGQERLESIPKFFYILFPSSRTTSGNGDASRQTDNTALIRQSNITLLLKFQWKQLCFKIITNLQTSPDWQQSTRSRRPLGECDPIPLNTSDFKIFLLLTEM